MANVRRAGRDSAGNRESYQISSRLDFDEFWVAGLELGQLHTPPSVIPPAGATVPGAQPVLDQPEVAVPVVEEPPVSAQVWWTYAATPPSNSQPRDRGPMVDLLIDPGAVGPSGPHTLSQGFNSVTAVRLIQEHLIDDHLSLESTVLNESFGYIALDLDYEDMVARLLPLTTWRDRLSEAVVLTQAQRYQALRIYRRLEGGSPEFMRIGWLLHLLAICGLGTTDGPATITYGARSQALQVVNRLLRRARFPTSDQPGVPLAPTQKTVGRVTLNRSVRASVTRSRRTVKADAARGLFQVRGDGIRWAVVDSGIDARHDWFRAIRPEGQPWADPFENDGKVFNYTRVAAAYDFTRQRTSGAVARRGDRGEQGAELPGDVPIALALGERFYEPPRNGHGTHVAGIIGGSEGLCPDIELLDYRVLDQDGYGNEFSVVAALRRILSLTRRASQADPTGRSRDLPIHGVNLALALHADVTSDACGWSLVCRVSDELVRAGVVVVASAGNTGFEDRTGALLSTGQEYRTVSITDPGNTDRVITVGSTDPDRPLEYGVSYFSARGPTADGRAKPDLVAPGNYITSAYGYKREGDDRRNMAAILSGTSMAAAHVSGCAAVLMARHRELIGKPEEVKRILMQTATDLHRDRNFQGAGLVDALRALQSV